MKFNPLFGLLPVAALTACASGGQFKPVTVDLATAQTYVQETSLAILAAAAAYQVEHPNPVVATGITALQTAEANFMALKSGSETAPQIASQVIAAAQQIVAVVPLPPAVSAGVQVALVVIGAFVNNLPMQAPPVPAALHG